MLTKAPSLGAILSIDCRTVLVRVSERLDGEETAASYRLYSTATGKEVGSFPEQETMSTLTVLGDRAYYVSTGPAGAAVPGAATAPAAAPAAGLRPRGLFAVDVTTGKILWAHSLDRRQAFPGRGMRPE